MDNIFRLIWSSALDQPAGGDPSEDFFASGGDSLAASELVAAVREQLGVVIDPGWLYEHPCLDKALDALRPLVDLSALDRGPDILDAHVRACEHPLSFQQRGLLAVLERVRDAHSYQVAYAVALPAGMDVGRLRDALAVLHQRHNALRTSIQHGAQRINDYSLDLEYLRSKVGQTVREGLAWAKAPIPFSGSRLARFALVEGDSEHLLVLAAHQMVMDPWSWGVLVRDVCRAYNDDEYPSESRPDYSDYARWQDAYARSAKYEEHLAFWRERSAGYPSKGLSLTGNPGNTSVAGPAAMLPVVITSQMVKKLGSLPRELQVSVFHLLLGLFQGSVSRWSQATDVVVGSATANRTLAGTTGMVGFFVNGRFSRTWIPKHASVGDLAVQVRDGWLLADAHQELHLEPTLFALGVPDLVNVKFSVNDIPAWRNPPLLGGKPIRHVSFSSAAGSSALTARRHLSMSLAPRVGGLQGALTYRTDLMSTETVRSLLRDFSDLLQRALEGPHVRIHT